MPTVYRLVHVLITLNVDKIIDHTCIIFILVVVVLLTTKNKWWNGTSCTLVAWYHSLSFFIPAEQVQSLSSPSFFIPAEQVHPKRMVICKWSIGTELSESPMYLNVSSITSRNTHTQTQAITDAGMALLKGSWSPKMYRTLLIPRRALKKIWETTTLIAGWKKRPRRSYT